MYGIYVSAAGAQTYSDYLDVLSNNLANVDTPGFKREFAIIQARPAEEVEQGNDTLGSGSINDVGGGVNLVETRTDYNVGTLKRTGSPNDVAIADRDGMTFFAVRKNNKIYLTRAGNFHITPQGQMQTPDGHTVMSAYGSPVRVDPRFPVQISDDGIINQQQAGISIPISLRRPQSKGDLVKIGHNMFEPLARTTEIDKRERNVRQGYIEHSTTKPVQEMMQLIQVTRAYEANVRMIQTHDSTMGALINRVLGQG